MPSAIVKSNEGLTAQHFRVYIKPALEDNELVSNNYHQTVNDNDYDCVLFTVAGDNLRESFEKAIQQAYNAIINDSDDERGQAKYKSPAYYLCDVREKKVLIGFQSEYQDNTAADKVFPQIVQQYEAGMTEKKMDALEETIRDFKKQTIGEI